MTPEERARYEADLQQRIAEREVKRAADREAAERRAAESERKAAAVKAEREAKQAKAKAERDAAEAHRLRYGDRSGAIVMAQGFVKDYLKSPRQKFAWSPTQVDDKGNGLWYVHSYVDTQNGFGADVRLYYAAWVKCQADDKWALDSLDVWEKNQPAQKLK